MDQDPRDQRDSHSLSVAALFALTQLRPREYPAQSKAEEGLQLLTIPISAKQCSFLATQPEGNDNWASRDSKTARLQLEQTSRRELKAAAPSAVLCRKEVDGFLKQQEKKKIKKKSSPPAIHPTEQGAYFSITEQHPPSQQRGRRGSNSALHPVALGQVPQGDSLFPPHQTKITN